MTRLRSRRGAGERASRDRWLISYADFITLLFAFFTTMYAVSTVDRDKLATVARGMQKAFDTVETRPGVSERLALASGSGVIGAGRERAETAEDARAEILRELSDDLQAGALQMSQDSRGLVLSIPEAGSFSVGSADLSAAAEETLSRLSRALLRLPHAVRIEGHTDDVPIHTSRFASNWDLSVARAVGVVRFLIERGGVAPDRLSAAGFGEYHPRAANDSDEDRRRNRRVDVIILSSVAAAQAPEVRPDDVEGVRP